MIPLYYFPLFPQVGVWVGIQGVGGGQVDSIIIRK